MELLRRLNQWPDKHLTVIAWIQGIAILALLVMIWNTRTTFMCFAVWIFANTYRDVAARQQVRVTDGEL